MRAQTEAPINDAIVNWCSDGEVVYRCVVLPDENPYAYLEYL